MRRGVSGAESRWKVHLVEAGLLILSAALFSLSFPSELAHGGMPLLAWFCLAPALYVINTASWRWVLVWGPLWGILNCVLTGYWLAGYHPLGLLIAAVVHGVWYLLLAGLCRLARELFPRQGLVLQVLVWLSYEYLRLQGFLGFPYGNLAYTQYDVAWVRSSASLWGIWGVGALVLIPSVLLAWWLADRSTPVPGHDPGRWKGLVPLAGVWLALVAGCLLWPLFDDNPFEARTQREMILVQQNMDPWKGGLKAYAESLDRLIRQTRQGLQVHPETDLVVWAETSFIPSVAWHDRFRQDPDKYALVRRLQDFSREIARPLVLGNDDAEPVARADGSLVRADYNAVLVMEQGRITGRYRKNRLVPFSEHFPWQKELPGIYRLLESGGGGFWQPGQGYGLLAAGGIRFGTPICFEDSFPDISRMFVAAGAEVLVNLSNDSWAASVPAAMQHLAMAVFRTVENRVAMVRSTNGGMSVLIQPDGAVTAMNRPFTESWLHVRVPVGGALRPTPARLAGDAPGLAASLLAALLLVLGLARRLARPGTGK